MNRTTWIVLGCLALMASSWAALPEAKEASIPAAVNNVDSAKMESDGPVSVASDRGQNSDVEDVIANHHFISFGDMYTDGNEKFLCVQTKDHKWAWWNPVSDTLSVPFDMKNCSIIKDFYSMGLDLHLINNLVQSAGYSAMMPGFDGSSFSGGVIHSGDNNPANHCGPNLRTFYTVLQRDKTEDSFYLVARLKKPEISEVGPYCEAPAQKIYQHFDTVGMLCSTDLGNGKTIIYSYGSRYSQPVLLLINTLPKTVWSSNSRNVFLVPASYISQDLSWKAGPDIERRYKALMDVIKESKSDLQVPVPVPITDTDYTCVNGLESKGFDHADAMKRCTFEQ
jgi:hypothetical protein